MRIHLLFVIGEDTFGLGFDLDWTRPVAVFELQLGPLNIWIGQGGYRTVALLGHPIYTRRS